MTKSPISDDSEDGFGAQEARSKPVRVTVDLKPSDYDFLRDFAHFARMTHADVLRSLIQLLTSDDDVAGRVRSMAKKSR